MQDYLNASPGLPLYAILPTLLLYVVMVGILLARTRNASARYLIFAIALRLIMSSQPRLSFLMSPVGLSWNAVISVAIIGGGLFFVRKNAGLRLIMPPILLLIAILIFSSMINDNIRPSIDTLLKYGYFSVVALLMYDASASSGIAAVCNRLLAVFILPYALQFGSFVLGVAKPNSDDGSASYIGGFNHEASFSIILITGLLVAAMNQKIRPGVQIILVLISVVGVFAANYRTAIVAMAPLLVGVLMMAVMRSVVHRQRPLVVAGAAVAMLAMVPVILTLVGDRFQTAGAFLEQPGLIFKEPGDFSQADHEILNDRAYIWAQYISAFKHGSARQHLVGKGVDVWADEIGIYAHNTIISTIYELGYLGAFAMLLLWAWMFVLALFSRPPLQFPLITAHIGFILLNMATMPFWLVEGLMFYGLLCGASAAAFVEARGRVSAARSKKGGVIRRHAFAPPSSQSVADAR